MEETFNTDRGEVPLHGVVRAVAIVSVISLVTLSIIAATLILVAGVLLESIFPELNTILLSDNSNFLELILTPKFIAVYAACAICGTVANFGIVFLLRFWNEFKNWSAFAQAWSAFAISWFLGGYGLPFFFNGILY